MKWPWSKRREAPKSKPPEFVIEHYPLAAIWVVRHKGMWVRLSYPSRVPELTEWVCFAKTCGSEKETRDLIARYLEFRDGKGVNYIPVTP